MHPVSPLPFDPHQAPRVFRPLCRLASPLTADRGVGHPSPLTADRGVGHPSPLTLPDPQQTPLSSLTLSSPVQIVGTFLESGTPEENDVIKQIAAKRPSAPSSDEDTDLAALSLLLAKM